MDTHDATRRIEQVWAAVAGLRHPDALGRQALATVAADPLGFLPIIRAQAVHLVRASWQKGWLPYDLARYLGHRFDDPAAAAAGAVVVDVAARTLDSGPADPRWATSADVAGSYVAGLGAQAAPGVVAWLDVLDTLRRLPPIAVLVPPPGGPAGAGQRIAGPASRSGVEPRTDAPVDERQLERVRALLAKAESTTFPDEAEALTAKAQELIARHSLEHALRSAGQPRSHTPSAVRIWLDDPYADAKSSIVARVAAANRCEAVYDQGLSCSTVFGFDHDLSAVQMLFASLLAQATGSMARHGSVRDPRGRSRTRSFRRAFLYGFAQRIGERLREVARAETDAADAASGGRLVPVLVHRHEQIEASLQAAFPELVRRPASITNVAGWQAGRVAADLAHVGADGPALRAG